MHSAQGSQPLTQAEIERGLQRLPVLSTTVMQVLDLMRRDDVDTTLVASTIARDPVLTARLLRLANSPFFGVAGKIASIKQACVVLGLHTVRNLAAAVSVSSSFQAVKGGTLDRRRLWQHALETAIAAQALARRCGHDSDVAFTAGLLHDLGKLVLDACFADTVQRIQGYQDKHLHDLAEAEKSVLGMDHGQLGAMVAKRWRLPELIQQVIAVHHEAEGDAYHPLVDIVRLADVSSNKPVPDDPEQLGRHFPEESIRRLGLDLATIQAWLAEVETSRAMADSLSDM